MKKDKLNLLSVDRAIYVLTNRGTNFTSGFFEDRAVFIPWEDPPEIWLSIQKKLMLNRADTDYYLLTALSILENNKSIRDSIPDHRPSFNIQNFSKETSQIVGGEIINYANHNSNFKEHNKPFPIPSVYTFIASVDSTGMIVRVGNSDIGTITPNIVIKYADSKDPNSYSILSGDWSKYIPFEGSIKIPKVWAPDSIFKINYFPVSINYKSWVDYICSDPGYSDFLDSVDLFDTFILSKQYTEKLAIFYLALIKHWDLKNL